MEAARWLSYDLIFFINEVCTDFTVHFGNRSPWEWFVFFSPFFLFGELPRYVLPAFAVLFARVLGLERPDAGSRKRFLESSPSVSVLLVGYNEEASIAKAIDSLMEFEYPGLEIIVIDDGSTDDMYGAAKPYADRGLIKLYRNSAASGRGGRPTASNTALVLSTGDFILSVDADTSFDRDTLLHMIGPFHDPRVGCVAGNLKVRNAGAGYWTRMQSLEYFQSISLWKRWLNILGWNMQASGAFGAFRRQVLMDCGAWDPELAEDADLSLKIRKAGWKITFAHRAIAMTSAPEKFRLLAGQRYRWDRGMLRTYFHKHLNLMRFWQFDWRDGMEMALEYFFSVFLTFLYPAWLGWMLWNHPLLLLYIYPITYCAYALTSAATIGVPILFSERRGDEWPLIFWTLLFPFYKGILRLVRLYALVLETLRINYEETYLPESSWRNAPRW